MQFNTVVARLERALRRPLPGPAAHDLLAPRPPREWPPGFDRTRIRDASGLVLLFPIDEQAHLVLTIRADTLQRHGGQVSLPGGVVDPGETIAEAALREAHEEIGLAPGDVRIIGEMTPVEIPVSGFRLHPVVGVAEARPALVPSDREVARILEIAVDRLIEPGSVTSRVVVRDGRQLTLPAFVVDGTEIWGATAMILAELKALLS